MLHLLNIESLDPYGQESYTCICVCIQQDALVLLIQLSPHLSAPAADGLDVYVQTIRSGRCSDRMVTTWVYRCVFNTVQLP